MTLGYTLLLMNLTIVPIILWGIYRNTQKSAYYLYLMWEDQVWKDQNE
jgi:hypothetical protein